MLASVESLLGSIWFAVMLGMMGLVGGYIACNRKSGK